MSIEEIQLLKSRLNEIDKLATELAAERFTVSLRLSAALARHARTHQPEESSKQLSKFYDSEFGGTGFEEKTA